MCVQHSLHVSYILSPWVKHSLCVSNTLLICDQHSQDGPRCGPPSVFPSVSNTHPLCVLHSFSISNTYHLCSTLPTCVRHTPSLCPTLTISDTRRTRLGAVRTGTPFLARKDLFDLSLGQTKPSRQGTLESMVPVLASIRINVIDKRLFVGVGSL